LKLNKIINEMFYKPKTAQPEIHQIGRSFLKVPLRGI